MPIYQIELDDGRVAEVDADSESAALSAVSSLPKSQGPHDFSATNMVKNIPGSAMNLASDLAQPFLSPIETAKSVGSLATGMAQKASDAYTGDNEYKDSPDVRSANSVIDSMKERYGGWDNLKRTAENDPVGILSDVAGIATGGGALAAKTAGKVASVANTASSTGRVADKIAGAAQMVEKAGKAIDPINMAVNTASAGVSRLTPAGLPAHMYESSAKFGTTIDPAQRERMVQTALDERIMPSQKGLNKLQGIIASESAAIESILTAAEEAGTSIPKGKLLSAVRKYRNSISKVTTPDYKKMTNQIDAVLNDLGEQWADIDTLTPNQVQQFKRSTDKLINFDAITQQSKIGTQGAQNASRSGAKAVLEEIDPSIGDKNRRIGDLIELRDDGLARSAARIENRDIIGMGPTVKVLPGAALGGAPGAIAGAGASVLTSPKIQAAIGIALNQLKKSPLRDIYFERNGTLTELGRQAAIQIGRAKENSQQEPQESMPQ